jgi:hypothetical protein
MLSSDSRVTCRLIYLKSTLQRCLQGCLSEDELKATDLNLSSSLILSFCDVVGDFHVLVPAKSVETCDSMMFTLSHQSQSFS